MTFKSLNWSIYALVENSNNSSNVKLIGTVNIDLQLNQARTATFKTLINSNDLSNNAQENIGKRIRLFVNSKKYFDGLIRSVDLNFDDRTATYHCSDLFEEYKSKHALAIKQNENLSYSKHIFDDYKTLSSQDLFDVYNDQSNFNFTLDVDNNAYYTEICKNASTDFNNDSNYDLVFNENNILLNGNAISFNQDVKKTRNKNFGVTNTNRDSITKADKLKSTKIETPKKSEYKPVNEIVYEFVYRYPILHQINLEYQVGPCATMTDATLGMLGGVAIPTKAALESAISQTNMYLLNPIVYENANSMSGNYTVNGTTISYTAPSNIVNTLFTQANFTLSYRYVTYETVRHFKIVRSLESIQKYGINRKYITKEVELMKNRFNVDDWTTFRQLSPNLTATYYNRFSLKNYRDCLDNLSVDYETRRDTIEIGDDINSVQNTLDVLDKLMTNEIKKEIEGSAQNNSDNFNKTTMTFKVSFDEIDVIKVGQTAKYETSFFKATGHVINISYEFDVSAKAVATVTMQILTTPIEFVEEYNNVEEALLTPAEITYNTTGDRIDTKLDTLNRSHFIPPAEISQISNLNGSQTVNYDGVTYDFVNQSNVPIYTSGVNNWSDVSLTNSYTTNLENLRQGYYAHNSKYNTTFYPNDTNIPSNIIVLKTINMPQFIDFNAIKVEVIKDITFSADIFEKL